jgi:hypothetical protein
MALKDWKKTNEERGNSFNESKSENYWDEWTNTKTGDKIFVGNITDKGIEKWYFEI